MTGGVITEEDDHIPPKVLLSKFLRKLADCLDSNLLTENQVQIIGEFYVSYVYQDKPENDDPEIFDQEEFMKFIFLGFYVYKILLKDQTV